MTKRRRASGPRSRTGCSTCRIRHVKCDEQKPECYQCKRTGRKCDGYSESRPGNNHQPVVPSKPMMTVDHRMVLRPGTQKERHYLYFFSSQTARALSGVFESDLWMRHLPQLSECEPVVRHATAAVSAAHERALVLQRNPSSTADRRAANDRFIIFHYNEAIRHLRTYLVSQNPRIDLLVITCFLFVCLEMLNGNHKQSLDHLEAGLKIVQSVIGRLQPLGSKLNATYHELWKLSLRLNIQLAMNGRPMVALDIKPTYPEVKRSDGRPVWSDIYWAQHALYKLMNKTLMFIRSAGHERTDRTHLMPQQSELRKEFQTWRSALENYANEAENSRKGDRRGLFFLRSLYLVSWIWTETCLARQETVFDNYNSAFAELVHCAGQVIDLDDATDRKSTNCAPDIFTLETRIVTGLYYTAIRCRDPIIRREAIRQMNRCTKQEGLWNKHIIVKIAQLVMELEEANMSSLDVQERVPVDRDRIYETVISCTQAENLRSTRQVILLSKPNGPDGAWLTRVRFVDWE
ncbi:transcriptional regulator family: Fungal Specific TF [Aspergillus niger]|nr:transcriptional regulator family: Fungal Specific TF [Aspergillus niger]KAI2856896.1 transcriptional regulator family: Fungal Specific TF [Aspergillus niger]KAI2903717.1 transcriptional regulator family: Fungal Specific TF [Aspergillus niger]KAI2910159.1 transcriptional regulator family: Fungal Specific TF [Aspergillus niger]KAI2910595.1 transcriptional regulator family: Fungal Specific TF [Aspergillus niger]